MEQNVTSIINLHNRELEPVRVQERHKNFWKGARLDYKRITEIMSETRKIIME